MLSLDLLLGDGILATDWSWTLSLPSEVSPMASACSSFLLLLARTFSLSVLLRLLGLGDHFALGLVIAEMLGRRLRLR